MLQLGRKKTVVVSIHGFGSRLSSEMNPLSKFLKKKHYDFRKFDIFDLKNPEDADPKQWISRCEEQVKKALDKSDHVVLLGFSMGGVIASYLASIYPVEQLILVAPAFRYLDLTLLKTAATNKIKEVAQNLEKDKKLKPSSQQVKCFVSIVDTYRSSIAQVDCPILIIHGTNDEVIDFESSREAYKKISHNKKRLIFLEGAHHRLLYDGMMEETAFAIIEQMLKKNLIK